MWAECVTASSMKCVSGALRQAFTSRPPGYRRFVFLFFFVSYIYIYVYIYMYIYIYMFFFIFVCVCVFIFFRCFLSFFKDRHLLPDLLDTGASQENVSEWQ